jgi:hypothetical protein
MNRMKVFNEEEVSILSDNLLLVGVLMLVPYKNLKYCYIEVSVANYSVN